MRLGERLERAALGQTCLCSRASLFIRRGASLPSAAFQNVLQHGSFNYPLASIRSRGQAANEGAEYLRQPTFSQCTVPVVWYPFWMNNFGHFLRGQSSEWFRRQLRSSV